MTLVERKAPKGILGFPVAPLGENGRLDEKALERNIQFLIEEGLTAIFIACGSGEFHALSKGEYQSMVEVAVTTASGKVPVYTGVGGNITHAIEQVKLSEDLGADGYLTLPPYLIEGEQEGIYNYYKEILENSNLNAIVYQRDNAILELETLQRLLDYPQVVGLKDGHGKMELVVEQTQTIGDRLQWINGMPFAEITMPTYIPLGFNTYSSAISNYLPHISRMYYKALTEGNHHLVRQLYVDVLLPINRIRKSRKGYAISLIKAGMEIVGLPVGNTVKPPVIPVKKEHYKMLEEIITSAIEKYPVENKKVNIDT
ncbi:5-dehydro-4-deoxyglucarate dehydratase [uncultured Metabacillus sp.]|uniref:5-dehydro-4-deoxyglucarate dehydratase n=1 Tax=uncultured Metabacillus sp. TaxID=2860135 RepID=UPI00260F088E|nr:5-dehydro-4-deoxyglucarate dehydratase [uncultured Metabacillus sp.]